MKWVTLKNAAALPADWDANASTNIFLKKAFLYHLEVTNPCHQSYNLLFDKDVLCGGYVDYINKLDIFTYSVLHLKTPVRIMGIPCSVSKQGFVFTAGYEQEAMRHFQSKPGAKLILNSEFPVGISVGETLPTCRLEIRWPTFSLYLQSLRSHYRYRLQKAQAKWVGVNVEMIEPQHFTEEMFSMYEKVYEKSPFKLEKLSLDFFVQLPLPAKVIIARYQKKLLGFAIVIENKSELIFLFTGFDYSTNAHFDTYLNLLMTILRFGIEGSFEMIDFGQTAEETKLKLGCTLVRKYLALHHSQPLLNKVANKLVGTLSYKALLDHYRVFKKE